MSHYDKLIPDFGLTAEELEERYERPGAHPCYTWDDWRAATTGCATRGYWHWLVAVLEEAEDELDSQNPYNLGAPQCK